MNIRGIVKETVQKIFDHWQLLENYPAGAEHDSSAPWNEKERKYTQGAGSDKTGFTTIGFYPHEIAILSDGTGKKYAFYFNHLNSSDLEPYADKEIVHSEKGITGDIDQEYGDWEVDGYVIQNYVNDNLSALTKGIGKEAWENGVSLVEIDENLKREILGMYGKNPTIQQALA
jgi:hypothetical protein